MEARHADVGNPFETGFSTLLKPEQWQRLVDRLGQIENPDVPIKPSQFAEPDSKQEKEEIGILEGDD